MLTGNSSSLGSFLVVTIAKTPQLTGGATVYAIIAVLTAAVFLILSIGITATFISMHDRFQSMATSAADMAECAANIAESAAKIASRTSERADKALSPKLADGELE